MSKKIFPAKGDERRARESGEIHRTGRSITSWSRCFQNSPQRHYISNTERERRNPRWGSGWQLRIRDKNSDNGPAATRQGSHRTGSTISLLLGNAVRGSLSSHFPWAWSPGHSASQAAKLMSCDGKCKPQAMNQSRSQTPR